MTWWIHRFVEDGQYIELVSWIFWVLLSITLHELAHGWTAIWQGDETPRLLNRLTMNPIVQMGPQSLLIFAICGIAWGAMPVNPSRFRDGRKGDIYVSAAGPAMNLLIGLVCTILLVLWLWICPEDLAAFRPVAVFLYFGVMLNFVLAPLNLLPIPPLDGSRILAGFSRKADELFSNPQAMIFGMMIFIAIFFMTPIGSYFFFAARMGAMIVIDLLGFPLGNTSIFEVLYLEQML